MRLPLVLAVLLATPAAADDNVHGFVAPTRGELAGRVTDARGNPLANATVHVVTKHGEQVITTDAQGRYRANIGERATLVFVHGDAQITGTAVTSEVVDVDGQKAEAIRLQDVLPPAKLAKPVSDPTIIPEYTDKMMDTDAWTRAWLLLDVTSTGAVARVKLLDVPGNDLEPIAIRDAFKLSFEPARDRADKPIRTQVLWLYEWPSFWWMQNNHYPRRRMPAEAYKVPCRGSGPTHAVYRDCRPANVGAAITAPWIDRPAKK